jgi:MFS transporter, FHS family, glucose/mannose:H+ symporter
MMPSETQTVPAKDTSAQNLIFMLLCGGFIVNGIIITFIGPILPVFIAKWKLDDTHAGMFFTTQFVGSFIGVLASSAVVSKKGFKPAITVGLAMMGVGFALWDVPSYFFALCASAFFGLGYGLSTPGTNLWVAETYGDRRASALNVANLAWGVGAISCSPLALVAVKTSHVPLMLYVVGALCCLLAIALLRMPFGHAAQVKESQPSSENSGGANMIAAVMLAILFFVYVGTENGISGWAAAQAKRYLTWNSDTWTLAPMFFFGGLLGGRAAGAAILLRLKETTVAVGGLLLAALGTIIFSSATYKLTLFGGVFLAGLGLSSVYPIFIAWLSKWFGARARRVGGVLFALASGGGAVMPPLVGVVSRSTHSLRWGLCVPLAGSVVMLAVIALLRPNSRS